MKHLALLAAVSCTLAVEPPENDVDVFLLGRSYHSNHNVDWNQNNLGAAVSVSHDLFHNNDAILTVGGYKDSCYKPARFALVGIRANWGDRDAFNWSLSASGGYYVGSGFHGYGVMPVASIGYKRVSLCVTGFPDTSVTPPTADGKPSRDPKDNPHACSGFVAVFVGIRLASF